MRFVKLLSFLVATCFVVCLVGCGSDGSDGDTLVVPGHSDGSGAAGAGGEGSESSPPSCEVTGLTVETTEIEKKEFGLRLTAQNSIEIPYDTDAHGIGKKVVARRNL